MNYQLIYNKIIERAEQRILLAYTENHHIIPRCLGGTDDGKNIVKLTPEEHYVVHQLLVKMYPDNRKLIYAARMMCVSSITTNRSNKLYGWLKRKQFANPMPQETKDKISKSRLGQTPTHIIPHTEESKKKISKTKTGIQTGPRSEETKERMAIAATGIKNSESHNKNISIAKKGKPWTQARIDAQNKRKLK